MNIKLINLDNRLRACANMIRKDAKLADIGTDHAYLPIFLMQTKLISRAIAADIKEGPLNCAKQNIRKYNLSDKIETRLSNGLENISPYEVDDIVIAGMGGELIIDIMSKASWLKNANKRLILQPMSMSKKLRAYLFNNNFKLLKEVAIYSDKRVYTVMLAEYTKVRQKYNEIELYIGALNQPLSAEAKAYIQKEINHLINQNKGLERENNLDTLNKNKLIINQLSDLLK